MIGITAMQNHAPTKTAIRRNNDGVDEIPVCDSVAGEPMRHWNGFMQDIKNEFDFLAALVFTHDTV